MGTGREDALELALSTLRARLRAGTLAPGARIPASRLGPSLRLSATPVREALSRLVGEGLVEERRNQGFFVQTLTGVDVADLYRLSLSQLLIFTAPSRARPTPLPAPTILGDDPVATVEDLFLNWTATAASRVLAQAHQATAIRLGPVRRVEGRVFDDLGEEASDLVRAAADTAAFVQALRRFHGRRIQAAERLASALNVLTRK